MAEMVQALAARLGASGERALLVVAGYVAAFLLFAFAFVAFAYAAATALSAAYGPVAAALSLGGASAILGLIVIAVLARRRARSARLARLRRPVVPLTAGLASAVLPQMVKASPIGTLLAVAAAAYVLQRASEGKRSDD